MTDTVPATTPTAAICPADPVGRFGWTDAMRDSDLPAPTRSILRVLSEYLDNATGRGRPSIDTLAHAAGRDRATVIRHLTAAEKAGWVQRTHRGGKRGGRGVTTRYQATVPADLAARNTSTTSTTTATGDDAVADFVTGWAALLGDQGYDGTALLDAKATGPFRQLVRGLLAAGWTREKLALGLGLLSPLGPWPPPAEVTAVVGLATRRAQELRGASPASIDDADVRAYPLASVRSTDSVSPAVAHDDTHRDDPPAEETSTTHLADILAGVAAQLTDPNRAAPGRRPHRTARQRYRDLADQSGALS